MQLYVDGEPFAAALAHAGRVQSGHDTLREVLLTAGDDALSITASDGYASELVQTIPASVGINGQSAVDAPFAQKFCAKLPRGRKVEISIDEDRKTSIKCLIRGDNYATATIHAGVEEYPEFKMDDADLKSLTTTAAQLGSMIKHCIDSTDENSPRTYLQGITYATHKQSLRLFASDGYRLAECKSPVAEPVSCEPAIVPVRVNKTLLALLAKIDPTTAVIVELSNEFSRFTIGESTVLSCKNTKSEFPSVDKLIPTDSTIQFTCNNQALVTSLKRMQPVFMNANDASVTLNISPDNVDVMSESQMGSITDPVVATANTEAYKSKFNCKHLLQSLASFPAKHDVKFIFPDEPGATIIRDATENAPPYQHIVMPIRV